MILHLLFFCSGAVAIAAWDCHGKEIQLHHNSLYPNSGNGHYNLPLDCSFKIPRWKEHYSHPTIQFNGGDEDYIIIKDDYGRNQTFNRKLNISFKHELVSAVDLTVILRTKPSINGGFFSIQSNYSSFYYMGMKESETFNVTEGAANWKIVQSRQQNQKHYTFDADHAMFITVDYVALDPRVGAYTVFAFDGPDLTGNYLGSFNPVKGEFVPVRSPNRTVSVIGVNSLNQGFIVARTENDFNKIANFKKVQKFLKTDVEEHSIELDAKLEPVLFSVGVRNIHFTDLCMSGQNPKLLWFSTETYPLDQPTEVWTRHNGTLPIPMIPPAFSTFLMTGGQLSLKFRTIQNNTFTELAIGDGAWYSTHPNHLGQHVVEVRGTFLNPRGSHLTVRVTNCASHVYLNFDNQLPYTQIFPSKPYSNWGNSFHLGLRTYQGPCMFHWKIEKKESYWSSLGKLVDKIIPDSIK